MLLETVAIGQGAEHRREQVEEEGGQALDDAAVLAGQAQPAVGHGPGQVQAADGVEAVPAHALEDLHDVGGPERRRELLPDRYFWLWTRCCPN